MYSLLLELPKPPFMRLGRCDFEGLNPSHPGRVETGHCSSRRGGACLGAADVLLEQWSRGPPRPR
eukprot:126610-Pyramimonas_sp.AAC.1